MMLIETMSNQGIKQILAKTTINNIASQKVLEKTGFKPIVINDEEFEKGQMVKFISYTSCIKKMLWFILWICSHETKPFFYIQLG